MTLAPEIVELLAAPLDMQRVKKNPKGFDHIEGHDAIRVANAIFGFDGWSHEIREMQALGAVPVTNDRGTPGWYVAYRAVVRVHALGVWHDGEGFGDSTGYQGDKSQLAGAEGASKEAETDALKRALVKFGDQFGLALYDKYKDTAGHILNGNGSAGTSSLPPQAPSRPAAPPAISTRTDVPAGMLLAGDVVCPVGKNKGSSVRQLSRNQLKWYAEDFSSTYPDGIAFKAAAAAFLADQNAVVPADEGVPF